MRRKRSRHEKTAVPCFLIDPSGYDCSNLGDMAMMKTAAERLWNLFPNAVVRILTDDAAGLTRLCPGVESVSGSGHDDWFEDHGLFGRLHQWLPGVFSAFLVMLTRVLRNNWPAAYEALIRLKMRLTRRDDRGLREFVDAFNEADVLLASGSGGLNDQSRRATIAVLNTMEFGLRRGKLTAMIGQNVGPLKNRELRAKAGAVLSRVNSIGVRDPRSAAVAREELGVKRVVISGDDAVEMAFKRAPAVFGNGLGINIRVHKSAQVEESVFELLRPVIGDLSRHFDACLVPLPSKRDSNLEDSRALRALLPQLESASDYGRGLDTPEALIREVGCCRCVLTGAYHVALFALSQGIPAVCLAASEYFMHKFLGLHDVFGDGCIVVSLEEPGLSSRLKEAVEIAWTNADIFRKTLLNVAHQQVELSHLAYEDLGALVTRQVAGKVAGRS